MTFSSAQTGLWSDCITSMHALYVCASTDTSEANAAAAVWLPDLFSACLGVPGAPSALGGGCLFLYVHHERHHGQASRLTGGQDIAK